MHTPSSLVARITLSAAIAALLVTLHGSLAMAQEPQPPKLTPLPEAPEPPPKVKSGEVLEPEVRIFTRGKERITEYRVNGKVRAIKVEPESGPPYYLVDNDGDGKMDSHRLGPDFLVPQWLLFSW